MKVQDLSLQDRLVQLIKDFDNSNSETANTVLDDIVEIIWEYKALIADTINEKHKYSIQNESDMLIQMGRILRNTYNLK